jgi:hypothetical protein
MGFMPLDNLVAARHNYAKVATLYSHQALPGVNKCHQTPRKAIVVPVRGTPGNCRNIPMLTG